MTATRNGPALARSFRDIVLTPTGVRFFGKRFPCSLGRAGLRIYKREGDGATPCGVHRITGVLYRADRLTSPAPWAKPIRKDDLWCDDETAPDYNQFVRAPYLFKHERLHRPDPLYDLIILTDWNYPNALPGQGSAIFLHQWRRRGYPTEGCLAFQRKHIQWIAAHAVPGTRVVIPPRV